VCTRKCKIFGNGDLGTERIDANLYSGCLYSKAHTIILHLGRNDMTITSTYFPRNIFNRIHAIVLYVRKSNQAK
jgi:hypothetical protein